MNCYFVSGELSNHLHRATPSFWSHLSATTPLNWTKWRWCWLRTLPWLTPSHLSCTLPPSSVVWWPGGGCTGRSGARSRQWLDHSSQVLLERGAGGMLELGTVWPVDDILFSYFINPTPSFKQIVNYNLIQPQGSQCCLYRLWTSVNWRVYCFLSAHAPGPTVQGTPSRQYCGVSYFLLS